MRDTSSWANNPLTSAQVITAQIRQRHPSFHWHSGSTYYSLSSLGQVWGDSPGTTPEIRERNLPTRNRYGGFAVMADSVTLSGGNILRITSLGAGNQGTDLLYRESDAPASLTSMSTYSLTSPPRTWTGIGLAQHSTANTARLFWIRASDNTMRYLDYTAGGSLAQDLPIALHPHSTLMGCRLHRSRTTRGLWIAQPPMLSLCIVSTPAVGQVLSCRCAISSTHSTVIGSMRLL